MLFTLLCFVLLLPLLAFAAGNETITPLPGTIPNTSSYNQIRTFNQNELPAVMFRMLGGGFVHTGGLHATSVSMISAAFATEAFTLAGNRVTANGSGGLEAINYTTAGCSANDTAWVIISGLTGATNANFHRVGASNYFVDCVHAAKPDLPADSTWLMKVTIASSALTAVEDLRVPASYVRSGTYDVTDHLYGGIPDDTTDVGPALQAALDGAAAQYGSIVRLPQGRYKLATAVSIPVGKGVILRGDPWVAPAQQLFETTAQPYRGSWLHISSPSFQPITIAGTGATLESLAFDHDQPVPTSGWAPTAYPYVIDIPSPDTCCNPQTNVGDINLTNLFFYKATKGIEQRASASWVAGRINMTGIWGQFFESAIAIEYTADVMRLNDIHLWPWWSQNADVLTYSESTMIGLILKRADNPMIRNFFVFSAYVGIDIIANSHGNTSAIQAVNLMFDKSRIGIYSNQAGTTGQFVNVLHNGGGLTAAMIPTGVGIALEGTNNTLEMVNVEVSNVGTSCASTNGAGNILTIVNLRCNNFNLSASGQAGLFTVNSGLMAVSGLLRFLTPNGALNYNGSFISPSNPNGVYFNETGSFFANTIGGNPTINFAANDYLQWLIATNRVKISTDAGTYNTGGVLKYLCIIDGELIPGTTCP